jgi:hypothetical protein
MDKNKQKRNPASAHYALDPFLILNDAGILSLPVSVQIGADAVYGSGLRQIPHKGY